MRWRHIVIAAALALPASFGVLAGERAIWVWEPETYAMLRSVADANAAIEFLSAKKIDCLYLYADAYKGRNILTESPASYGQLIRRLRANGIRTYALLGSWHLHTERYVLPAHHGEALTMLRRVLEYNAAAPAEERFEGVNLDIEPHLLDEWNAGTRVGLLRDFLDMSALLMAVKRDLRATVPIGPAIPFWLDGIRLDWHGAEKAVSEHVLDTYDYAALMDYRDHADGRDGMVEHARREMAYAAERGKHLVIGVDVSPGEPKKVSFDHRREADLERALAATAQVYRDSPAFGGFVIHHFAAYRRWLARQPAGSP
jgi:hypothetical protein